MPTSKLEENSGKLEKIGEKLGEIGGNWGKLGEIRGNRGKLKGQPANQRPILATTNKLTCNKKEMEEKPILKNKSGRKIRARAARARGPGQSRQGPVTEPRQARKPKRPITNHRAKTSTRTKETDHKSQSQDKHANQGDRSQIREPRQAR